MQARLTQKTPGSTNKRLDCNGVLFKSLKSPGVGVQEIGLRVVWTRTSLWLIPLIVNLHLLGLAENEWQCVCIVPDLGLSSTA